MILKIHTDGGSKGNPGPSAVGVVYYLDGKEVFTYREDIGITTNNVAEYTAVIRALQKFSDFKASLSDEKIEKVEFYSDSTLLVNQVNGLFKVKHANIIPLIDEVRTLIVALNLPITFTYVPREQNKKADALVNNSL